MKELTDEKVLEITDEDKNTLACFIDKNNGMLYLYGISIDLCKGVIELDRDQVADLKDFLNENARDRYGNDG